MNSLKTLYTYEPYIESQYLQIVEARKDTLEELYIFSQFCGLNFVDSFSKIKHLKMAYFALVDIDMLPKLVHLASLEIFLNVNVAVGNVENKVLGTTKVLPPDSLPGLTSLRILSRRADGHLDDANFELDGTLVR